MALFQYMHKLLEIEERLILLIVIQPFINEVVQHEYLIIMSTLFKKKGIYLPLPTFNVQVKKRFEWFINILLQ